MPLRILTNVLANDHDAPAVPPREFRIFREGKNSSEKGDFLFDREAATSVMEHAKRWANRFPIDYAHGMVRPTEGDPAEQHKAAGWFTPELRGGELWAVDVNWTPLAHARIANREFVYFSPAFTVDENERVTELTNVALTNIPAMHGLDPLVAADKIMCGYVPDDGGPPIVDRAWDADAAIKRLRTWAGVDPSNLADAALKKYARAFAYVRNDGKALGDYALPHHDIVGGKFVTIRAGVIAAGNAIQGARGGVSIPTADLAKVKAHLAAHYHQMKMRAPWESRENARGTMKTKDELKADIHAKHAKVHGKMYDEDMKAAYDKKMDDMEMDDLKAYDERLAKMIPHNGENPDEPPHAEPDADDEPKTGKKADKAEDDEDESADKAHDRRVLVSKVVELERKLSAIEAKGEADERKALLDQAQKDRWITPAQANGKFYRSLSISTLKDLLADIRATGTRVVHSSGDAPTQPGNQTHADGKTFEVELESGVRQTVTLSKTHLDVARAFGGSPKELARTVAEENARRSA